MKYEKLPMELCTATMYACEKYVMVHEREYILGGILRINQERIAETLKKFLRSAFFSFTACFPCLLLMFATAHASITTKRDSFSSS